MADLALVCDDGGGAELPKRIGCLQMAAKLGDDANLQRDERNFDVDGDDRTSGDSGAPRRQAEARMLDSGHAVENIAFSGLTCDIVGGVRETDKAFWQRAMPDDPEGYALQAGCEAAGRGAFGLMAAVVRSGPRTLAVCPLFKVDYRLDTSLQGTAQTVSRAIGRLMPGFTHMRLIGFGSPYSDFCAVAIDPDLDDENARLVLRVLVDGVLAYGAAQKIALFAVKDLQDHRAPAFAEVLREKHFSPMSALPNCAIDLPYSDIEAYLATLSRPTRKDIRRKLKSAGPIEIETRTGIEDIKTELRALYEETRGASALDYGDFETLPENYFEAVSRSMGDRAVFMLYRIDGQLAAFNLLLIGDDRIVDKFLGMRKDLAARHNLYVVSWIENIRYCIDRGASTMQFGPTAYALKLRFGCRLEAANIWFRHTKPMANAVLRGLAPLAAFDRLDPDLAQWRKRKRKSKTLPGAGAKTAT